MTELSIYRVVVQARKNSAGTYTYVITRTDDHTWEESTESYTPAPKRPRKADGLLWAAFGQRRRRVNHDLVRSKNQNCRKDGELSIPLVVSPGGAGYDFAAINRNGLAWKTNGLGAHPGLRHGDGGPGAAGAE
jgi:hypothetical protein